MMATSLLPKPLETDTDVELVEGYGDIAVERWQRTHAFRPGRRRHSPYMCCCLACADGRELMGLTAFKPSWRSLVPELLPVTVGVKDGAS